MTGILTKEEAIAEHHKRLKHNRIKAYRPYRWQAEFHNAGFDSPERMLMAANRNGKTHSAANETSYHATGKYPDWWEGRRFDGPVLIWIGSVTNEASRDIVQKELIGDPKGTGAIPGKTLGKITYKQAGVSNVADTLRVKHVSGGHSSIVFKTYEQGWRKWQGAAPHVVWMDEEPANKKDEKGIYTEALTRILSSQGIIYVTFTPLLGQTDLVRHFMNPPAGGIYLKTATWDNAPHLNESEKERLAASYPDHERDTRTQGIPMMGEGKVFTVAESEIKIQRRDIPVHWPQICGIDFGTAGSGGHPSAGAWIAWDRDADAVYVTSCYRVKGETTAYHAEAIKQRGQWIPVSWPHDGVNVERSNGVPLWRSFQQHGVNMLGMSARYENDIGGAQPVEPIVMEVLEMMKTGRFFAFAHLIPFFEEFRNYHREDGRIVAKNDDVMKAVFYAVMMRRHALVQRNPWKARKRAEPLVAGWTA